MKPFTVRLTDEERAWIEQRAAEDGRQPSVWARKRILRDFKRAR